MNVIDKYTWIILVLLCVSEGLAFVPALKSNGVLQLVVNVLKGLRDLITRKPPQ